MNNYFFLKGGQNERGQNEWGQNERGQNERGQNEWGQNEWGHFVNIEDYHCNKEYSKIEIEKIEIEKIEIEKIEIEKMEKMEKGRKNIENEDYIKYNPKFNRIITIVKVFYNIYNFGIYIVKSCNSFVSLLSSNKNNKIHTIDKINI